MRGETKYYHCMCVRVLYRSETVCVIMHFPKDEKRTYRRRTFLRMSEKSIAVSQTEIS